MILKPRKIPLSVQKYQALTRRTPPNHPKIPLIKENLRKGIAGYKGECAIDYPLSFLSNKKYSILHDVRLPDESRFFQMDSVLICNEFILILEVKNIAGKLYFDPVFNQLIRTIGAEEKALSDPLTQVKRHEEQFQRWLNGNKLPSIPILSLVVISHPSTIITTSPENRNLNKIVIHRDQLPIKIMQIEKQYHEPLISEKERKKIGQMIIKQHTEANFPILEKLQMSKKDLLKGVHCPNCEHLPMEKTYGTWFCPSCHHKNKNAHVISLIDYALLIDPTITNQKMRDFLQIASANLCTRLIREMDLQSTGENKGRSYRLPQ